MKAKDYINKYQEDFLSKNSERVLDAATKLLNEMIDEVNAIAELRNVKLVRGFVPIIKEQNQKWNAIASHFPGIMKRNGFIEVIKTVVFPSLAQYL